MRSCIIYVLELWNRRRWGEQDK